MTVPTFLRLFCILLTVFSFTVPATHGQQAAALDKFPADTVALRRDIAFGQIRTRGAGGDWMSVTMELLPNLNPDPNAKSREFLENVEIILHMAFKAETGENGEPKFEFYQSRSTIVIMKARQPVITAFFLPGHIVERDKLPREPDYWAVEINVNNVPQEPSKSLVHRYYKSNLEQLPNFLQKSATDSRANDGLLMPQYLAPAEIAVQARVDTTIPFLREVK
jgi:hypothetical protein